MVVRIIGFLLEKMDTWNKELRKMEERENWAAPF